MNAACKSAAHARKRLLGQTARSDGPVPAGSALETRARKSPHADVGAEAVSLRRRKKIQEEKSDTEGPLPVDDQQKPQ
jgi:hypothetical protein